MAKKRQEPPATCAACRAEGWSFWFCGRCDAGPFCEACAPVHEGTHEDQGRLL